MGGTIDSLIANFIYSIGKALVKLGINNIQVDRKVDGKWSAKAEEGTESYKGIVEASQYFSIVKGIISYELGNTSLDYYFSGRFKDHILTAEYWPKNPNGIDRGTFTLLYQNEDTMEGNYFFCHDKIRKVRTGALEWKRRQ